MASLELLSAKTHKTHKKFFYSFALLAPYCGKKGLDVLPGDLTFMS